MNATAVYVLSSDGFNVFVDGKLMSFGKSVHQWSMPYGTASLRLDSRGFTLVLKYFEPKRIDNRSAGVGRMWYSQKKFVTPLSPTDAVRLLNREINPSGLTKAYHRKMVS